MPNPRCIDHSIARIPHSVVRIIRERAIWQEKKEIKKINRPQIKMDTFIRKSIVLHDSYVAFRQTIIFCFSLVIVRHLQRWQIRCLPSGFLRQQIRHTTCFRWRRNYSSKMFWRVWLSEVISHRCNFDIFFILICLTVIFSSVVCPLAASPNIRWLNFQQYVSEVFPCVSIEQWRCKCREKFPQASKFSFLLYLLHKWTHAQLNIYQHPISCFLPQ